jgi:branched-chain amino acid transport system ATP-binding protein/nonpolar-amino-acid-transporting ATPase
MLLIENIMSGYGAVTVLRDVNLFVGANEAVAVIGPNGAGKSTLVRAICGLIPIWKGRIVKDDVELNGAPPHRRAAAGIGVVLENRRLFGELPVRTNLELAANEGARRSKERFSYASVLELFPFMAQRLDSNVELLSGGEQQMVAIARALLLQPDLLILDEPSTGLAPKIVKGLVSVIEEVRRREVSMLLIEQNVALVAQTANRTYVMKLGQIVDEFDSSSWEDAMRDERLAKAYLGE